MKIIDMEGLLVRLVDNLVSVSASEVSEGDEVLKTQAHFYRVRHDGRDTHYSAVGRVRRAIALRAADAMAPPEKTDGPHIQAAGSRDVRQRGS